MVDIWSLLAFQLIAVLSGAATAGLALVLGGLGGQLALSRRLKLTEQRVEDVDGRITTEVKKRAANAATESRKQAKSVEQEAAEIIADSAAGGAKPGTARPSIAHLR